MLEAPMSVWEALEEDVPDEEGSIPRESELVKAEPDSELEPADELVAGDEEKGDSDPDPHETNKTASAANPDKVKDLCIQNLRFRGRPIRAPKGDLSSWVFSD